MKPITDVQNSGSSEKQLRWAEMTRQLVTALVAVAAALFVGALFIVTLGANPFLAYGAIISGAFGNINALAETVVKATPLLLAGLGLSIAYRANMWNIGAEGQIFAGGMAAAATALWLGNSLPPVLLIPLQLLAGFTVGAFWAYIPAFLKTRLGIDEIINTIMLNYIAALGVAWIIQNPLRDPSAGFPRTSIIPEAAQLPILLPRTRLHIGVLFALAAMVLIHVILWKTSPGFKIRSVGDNRDAANACGIKVNRVLIISMVISGGLAGIAGMVQVSGLHFRMIQDISGGIGFSAIAVTLLAGNQPLALIVSAFFMASLDVGANTMQYRADVPVAVVHLIQGLVILFVVAREFLYRRITMRNRVSEKMDLDESEVISNACGELP
jgi:general nucleoside transport system permease protein